MRAGRGRVPPGRDVPASQCWHIGAEALHSRHSEQRGGFVSLRSSRSPFAGASFHPRTEKRFQNYRLPDARIAFSADAEVVRFPLVARPSTSAYSIRGSLMKSVRRTARRRESVPSELAHAGTRSTMEVFPKVASTRPPTARAPRVGMGMGRSLRSPSLRLHPS